MVKPTGRPSSREIRSQKSQLDSHPHGTEKGVKWKMSVKNSSSDNYGPRNDTGLRGKNIDPQIYEVQRMLDADKDLSAYSLKAEHVNNTLQIIGIVDTLEEKDHLKSLLTGMGISAFSDGVSISTNGQVLDDHVALEVREEIEADPKLTGTGISVECIGGTVFLAGNVESRLQEDAAIAAARKARGVTRVVSELNFMPGNMDLEGIFHSQVNNERHNWKE